MFTSHYNNLIIHSIFVGLTVPLGGYRVNSVFVLVLVSTRGLYLWRKKLVLCSKKVLLPILLILLSLPSCQDFIETINIVTDATHQEQLSYERLNNRINDHGEENFIRFKDWVNDYLDVVILTDRTQQKLQTVRGVEKNYSINKIRELKRALDNLFYRDVAITVLIPSWHNVESDRLLDKLLRGFDELRNTYKLIFDEEPGPKKFSIEILHDESLLDTRQICLEKFILPKLLDVLAGAVSNIPHDEAEYCLIAADRACGHQMDMNCLEEKVLLIAAKVSRIGCTELRFPNNGFPRGAGGGLRYPATWLISEIEACVSQDSVFKY